MVQRPDGQPWDDDDPPLNAGHYHEVMDRTALMQNTWLREVADLRAVTTHPKLHKQAEKVFNAMLRFYQLSGEVYTIKADEEEE